MRLPYSQIATELYDVAAPALSVELELSRAVAFEALYRLVRWALERAPDHLPPSASSVEGPLAARHIARATGLELPAEQVLEALLAIHLLEPTPTGGYRIRGLKRYDRAWSKKHPEEWKAWRAGQSGASGAENVPSSGTGGAGKVPRKRPKTETETETERKTDQKQPPSSPPPSAPEGGEGLAKEPPPPDTTPPPPASPPAAGSKRAPGPSPMTRRAKLARRVVPPELELQAQAVYAHHLRTFPPKRPALKKFCDDEREAVLRALESGWSVEALCLAVDGCAVNPWHQGQNPAGKIHRDLELIVRDDAHVRQFHGYLEEHERRSEPPPAPAPPSLTSAEAEGLERVKVHSAPRDSAAGELWAGVLQGVETEGKSYALTWLAKMGAARLEGEELVLLVPDRFFRDWVDDHYRALLETTASRLAGTSLRVAYEVAGAITAEEASCH